MILAAENGCCQFQNPGASIQYGAATHSCSGSIILFLSILEEFVRGRCAIADPCNRVVGTPDEELVEEYDFIVVGGGSGGSVVAGRLSENKNFTVLVLEAGGPDPLMSRVPFFFSYFWNNPETDWMYYTQPGNYCLNNGEKGCQWTRGKTLGGSGVLNEMLYTRGHKADFDVDWKETGVKGWSWAENKKYFDMSEDNKEIGSVFKAENHGVGGPMPIQKFRYAPPMVQELLDAASSVGYPIIGDLTDPATPEGFGIAQCFTDDGQRMSPGRVYLKPEWIRPNLHVRVHSLASRILFNGTTAYGVEYIADGEKRTVKAKKEVIISGGAINSPQLLMLSGVGPSSTLQQHGIPVVADLPVGQNLRNCVGVNLYFVLENGQNVTLDWSNATEYLLERTGPMSAIGISQVTALLYSSVANKAAGQPDIQIVNSLTSECSNKTGFLAQIAASKPNSVGYLTLNTTNPEDHPLLYPNYFNDPIDMVVVKDGARHVKKFVDAAIFKEKYGIKLDSSYSACASSGEEWSDEWLECTIRTYTDTQNHMVGTARIGSVVDEELRVYNVTGLRVIDASVLPVPPTGTPQAIVVMAAERGAESISRKWGTA